MSANLTSGEFSSTESIIHTSILLCDVQCACINERMTLMLGSDLSPDNGNQDDNTEWEAEGGMSTCKCQLESHSANPNLENLFQQN